MKKICFTLLTIQLMSCAHEEKQFNDHLSGLRCEEAGNHLPGSTPLAKTAKGV